MKLNEIQETPYYTDPGDVKKWLTFMGFNLHPNMTNCRIHDDGTVDVHGDVNLRSKHLHNIPVKFGIVEGDFDCYGNYLTEFSGLPAEVHGNLEFRQSVPLKSLVGISDIVQQINEELFFTNRVRHGGIGLLLIKNLKDFPKFGVYGTATHPDDDDKLALPSDIIFKYLGKPDRIFDCQMELIEAGLEDYAIL